MPASAPAPLLTLLATGFLLGWSVAWPPGPINAEIARRCGSGRFASGLAVLAGASSADALWAVAAALGVGLLFTTAAARAAMGAVSIALLVALAFVFLRGAWRAFADGGRTAASATPDPPARFASVHGGFGLGAAMALTSPWNVAFWLAAMGRPGLAGATTGALLVTAAAVIAGALAWGILWATANALLHRSLDGGARRAWTIFVDLATGLLMLAFAATSAQRLIAG